MGHIMLQKDLKAREERAHIWGMSFNPTKCYTMRLGMGRNLSSKIYTLCSQPLEQVENNPYLGILLNQNIKWSLHIAKVTKKTNGTLAFLW